MTVEVTASDSVPTHDTVQNLTVTLTDTNDNAPVFTSSATPSVAENTTAVVTLDGDRCRHGRRSDHVLDHGRCRRRRCSRFVGGHARVRRARATSRPEPHSYAVEVTANDGTNNTVQYITVDADRRERQRAGVHLLGDAERCRERHAGRRPDRDRCRHRRRVRRFSPSPAAPTRRCSDRRRQPAAVHRRRAISRPQAHSYDVQVTASDRRNDTVQNITVTLTD